MARPVQDRRVPPLWLVIMGVSGCGKTTLAQTVSSAVELPFIEGDDFHSADSIAKMRLGVGLSDSDRRAWLDRLAAELRWRDDGAVLSCSCLKEAYRQSLRDAGRGLKFVYLEIDPAEALSRVAARTDHIFPASLVDSQFATLEPPAPGSDVLVLPADQSPSALCAQVVRWLGQDAGPTAIQPINVGE